MNRLLKGKTKKFSQMLAICLAMLLLSANLAGCGKGAESSGTPTNEAKGEESTDNGNVAEDKTVITDDEKGAAVAEDAEAGIQDNLTVGTAAVLKTLTPFRNTSLQYNYIFRLLFDRLATMSEGEYVPQVAKSWEVREDGKTWDIEIFDYVYDSAGNHITASDIVWIINTYKESGLKPCFAKVVSVEQTGDYTFTMELTDSLYGSLNLILFSTYVVSQKAYEESPNGMAEELISTSPYKVTEFSPGASITFSRRDDYWQKEGLIPENAKANVQTFKMVQITEASQQQVALETGQVDIFPGIASTLVDTFKNNEDFNIHAGYGDHQHVLYFSGAPTSPCAEDLNLRLAICYALDVQGIIDGAFDGYGEAAHAFVPKTAIGALEKWQEEEYFPYDPELAKEYLEKSNYNGEKLILMGPASVYSRMGVVMQAQLAAVGIDVELQMLDSAMFSASAYDGSTFDMTLTMSGVTVVNVWQERFDSNAYEKGDAASRKDPVLQELLETGWTLDGFTEENVDAVNQYINDNCYAYGMVLGKNYTVSRADIDIMKYVTTGSE